MSFKRGGAEIGTARVGAGSSATLAVGDLPPGGSSLTAVYSGDATHEPSTSPAVTQTVGKATPTVTLTSTPNPSTVGSPVSLTATVTNGFQPSGTVTYKDGATTLGIGTVTSGVATYTATALAQETGA